MPPPPGDVYFYTDDNHRFEEGGVPLVDGREYTYFVTARDILGRHGISSPGAVVTIRDRLAPPAPRQLQATAVSDQENGGQAIRVTFEPNVSPAPNGEVIRRYHLYRWNAIEEIDIRSAVAPIDSQDHFEGTRSFTDRGPNTIGQVFWYTVRAEDNADADGLGNGNLSNHSRPVSAALRDRAAPDTPDASVEINCLTPVVNPLAVIPGGLPPLPPVRDPDLTNVRLVCTKKNAADQFDWVEFWGQSPSNPEPILLTRAYFPSPDAALVFADLDIDFPKNSKASLDVTCRVSARGKVGAFSAPVTLGFSTDPPERQSAAFEAEIQIIRAPVSPDCMDHSPGDPPTAGGDLPPGVTAWNFQMRVDDGPYQLIAQGSRQGNENTIEVALEALPSYARTLCIYYQVFDSSGNASPLTEIACISVRAPGLPAPLLEAPRGIGTQDIPMANLSWFCPPATAERFRLFVGIQDDGAAVPSDISGQLGSGGPPVQPGPVAEFSETFRTFETGRIAGSFPPVDDAMFELPVSVVPGLTYIYYVQAIGPNGEQGPVSNSQTFRWTPPEAVYAACSAPLTWPAETVVEDYADWIVALAPRPIDGRIALSQSNDPLVRGGVLVHIGRFPWTDFYDNQMPIPASGLRKMVIPPGGKATEAYIFPGPGTGPAVNFRDYLFEPSLMPLVLYRGMVSSDLYDTAGGETYQVSPLMETITQETVNNGGSLETRIYDPYIVMEPGTDGEGKEIVDIFLRDTQPVIRGTRYHYILVNFDPRSKEIAKVRSLGIREIN